MKEDPKPRVERRSLDSRLRRLMIRDAIWFQDVNDRVEEVKRRIEERVRRLLGDEVPIDPPECEDAEKHG
jgi:hypothetical protein